MNTMPRLSEADTSPPLSCNLCGADDYDVLFEAGAAQIARIVKCRQCGLMYANPRGRLVDHENYEQAEPEGLLKGVEEDLGLMQADGLHPTAAAQPVILENLWPALEPLVTGASP